MERNDLILANKAEVLSRRKPQLLHQIAESESRLAELSAEYDRTLASTRAKAASGPPIPRPAKELEKNRALQKEAFRQAFIVGLVFPLVIGLVVLLAR